MEQFGAEVNILTFPEICLSQKNLISAQSGIKETFLGKKFEITKISQDLLNRFFCYFVLVYIKFSLILLKCCCHTHYKVCSFTIATEFVRFKKQELYLGIIVDNFSQMSIAKSMNTSFTYIMFYCSFLGMSRSTETCVSWKCCKKNHINGKLRLLASGCVFCNFCHLNFLLLLLSWS